MASLLELQDLYNESLVREIIEKTKSCGLNWTGLGGAQFQATYTDTTVNPNIQWDIFITMTMIGNASAKYNLDIKKNLVSYVTIQDGPLPFTGRDSVVMDLYNIVNLIVNQLDMKLKETLQIVQGIPDCRS